MNSFLLVVTAVLVGQVVEVVKRAIAIGQESSSAEHAESMGGSTLLVITGLLTALVTGLLLR